MKPFLKWVGGKTKLLPKIYENFPKEFHDYYEPFLGGGSVFLNFPLNKQLFLSDINSDLILCYTFIRESNDFEFKLFLKDLKYLYKTHTKDHYYERRDKKNMEVYQNVSKFIYLNKTCFNGLYRVNKSGKFNVSIGSIKQIDIDLEIENLKNFRKHLKKMNVSFENDSYEKIKPKKNDFVYLDPPYFNTFNCYTKKNFDQNKLKDFCDDLNEKGIYFLLSNINCDEMKNLYKDYCFKEIEVQSGMGRKKQKELLVKNYDV